MYIYFFPQIYIYIYILCRNINMINLLLNELKLVAKNRNINDYENKSEEDLTKILSELKPKISIPKKNIKEMKKDFSKLRHKFSKEEIEKFRKSFYNIKNLSSAEIRAAEKNLVELEERLQYKTFYDHNYNDEYKKINSIRRLFDGFKPIKTDDSFDGKKIAYISEGDEYENLSPKEYLNRIGPYLRDLINDHKNPMKTNIENNFTNISRSKRNI